MIHGTFLAQLLLSCANPARTHLVVDMELRKVHNSLAGRVCTCLFYEEYTICKHRVSAAFLVRCRILVSTVVTQTSHLPRQPLPISDSLLVA